MTGEGPAGRLCAMASLASLLRIALPALLLCACAAAPRAIPAPDAAHYDRAVVPGFTAIRFWADETPPEFGRHIDARRVTLQRNPSLAERQDFLALSGGAEDGAYGAGFLKGWTERGDRPEFTGVTGISTGALMAPFAFLGSDYDDAIERFYTETSAEDIVSLRPLRVLFGASAVGDNAPLRRIIEEEVDAELVAAIARENHRGRTLLIGTTHLDAQRHMMWNIGEIAESGHPGALALIRKILLASAAIPAAFPPVLIDVMIDGERYQELHVDGGITHQIFAYPPAIRFREIEARLGIAPKKTLWVIRNTKIGADYRPVESGVASIAARSINTLTKYQGRGDLLALESLARRDGFDFRLTYVPDSFDLPYEALFDPAYMSALYAVGYRAALEDSPWETGVSELLNSQHSPNPARAGAAGG